MDDTSSTEYAVGLIADPGLPLELAEDFRSRLPEMLEDIDDSVEWMVEVEELSLPLDEGGGVKLNVNSETLRGQRNWDYLVYLTDLPKYVENEPLLSTVNAGYGSAMIVLPSLGIVRRKRLKESLLEVLDALHTAKGQRRKYKTGNSLTKRVFSRDDGSDAPESEDTFETVKGVAGRILMQAGMVRSNRPWRLLPQLSTSIAAAIATGAFGVFYTSIWSMADYLPPWRLLVISLLSVAIMSTWLIASNRLWERPRGIHRRERKITYNMATVTTIVIGVSAMYVVLFAVILAGALIIIDHQFIAEQLGHEAGFGEFVNLSWLSASLGTIAGAVGSSFDDDDAVRKATFSSREYQRRQISLAIEEHDDEADVRTDT
jgi:hypothetical protein